VVVLVRTGSNPVQPEISGKSGAAMANIERRNRRLGWEPAGEPLRERCDTPGTPVSNPPSTDGAVFPPLT
jgi:hypothetical protein